MGHQGALKLKTYFGMKRFASFLQFFLSVRFRSYGKFIVMESRAYPDPDQMTNWRG
jgi:hypothetical protein